MTTTLGIDPGLSGAIAFYHTSPGSILTIFDMPTLTLMRNKKQKRSVNLYELARIIDSIKTKISRAFIEDVTASPQMGVTSAFSFGFSAGVVQMAVAANFIPTTLVRPELWKKALHVPKDKDGARAAASKIFPAYVGLWARGVDDGRAEAALIAYYGAIQVNLEGADHAAA